MFLDRAVAALGLAIATALGAAVLAGTVARSNEPVVIDLTIHYSRFEPASISVPAGRPVTFVLHNADPIDHEWIVGDEALHERHRAGTEPVHDARPTEVSIGALTERSTTVTFAQPATLTFICHLPGHEAYGMTGTLTVTGR
jgi:uncharacterized cupredoxin-like copper-binding protein